MKRSLLLKFLIIFIVLSFNLSGKNVESSEVENYSEEVKVILNDTDPNRFISLDGVEILEDEYEEMLNYFKENNIIKDKNSDEENLWNCYSWITNNIKYEESDNSPYQVFKNRKGICQGYANIFKVLSYMCNVPCLVVNGDTSFGAHAWNYIYLKKWLQADLTNLISWEEKEQESSFDKYNPIYLSPSLDEDNGVEYYYASGLTVNFVGDKEIVKVPNKWKDNYITNLNNHLNSKENNFIKTIIINDYLKEVSNFFLNNYPNLERFEGENDNFKSENGILYVKDYNEKLCFIPRQIKKIKFPSTLIIEKNTLYDLPVLEEIEFSNGTEVINEFAIEKCPNLKRIIIPDTVKTIYSNSLGKSDFTIYTDNTVIIQMAIENDFSCKRISELEESNDGNQNGIESPSVDSGKDIEKIVLTITIIILLMICILIVILKRKFSKKL